MALSISKRQVDGGTVIVDLNGRITLREGSVTLGDAIHELVCKGNKKILLNFGLVNYVDSSGIGELVRAHVSVRSQGGEMTLYNVSRKIMELLEMTNLTAILDVKGDEAAALTPAHPRSA